MIDDDLIARVRAKAGGMIHDVEAALGIYRRSFDLMEKYAGLGRTEDSQRWKIKVEQYERSLLSFLVTGDMLESRDLVREAMEREGKLKPGGS